MLDKHEQFARDAKADGAQVICFQELFYGPYFGITEDKKYYRYAEPADGPIVQRFAALAAELNMVMILPIYEEDITGVYYNTAVVVDADGEILGKYRKHHIPHLDRFWEKFYFRPGNGGYPVFDTKVGKVGVYICYDRHFSRGKFRVRGDTIEIIPVYEEHAIRIEMFGDEIEALYALHPLTGNVLSKMDAISVFPATHYAAGPETKKRANATIKNELKERAEEVEAP